MRYVLTLLMLIGSIGVSSVEAVAADPAIEAKSDDTWKIRVRGDFDPDPAPSIHGFNETTGKKIDLSDPVMSPGTQVYTLSKKAAGSYTFFVHGQIEGESVGVMSRISFAGDGTGSSTVKPPQDTEAAATATVTSPTEETETATVTREKSIVTDVDYKLVEFTIKAIATAKRPYFDHHPVTTTAELSELFMRTARAAVASTPATLPTVKQNYKKEKDRLLAAKPGRKDDWAYVLRVVDNEIVRKKQQGELDFDQPRDMAAIYEELGLAFAQLSDQYTTQRAEEDVLIKEYLEAGQFGGYGSGYVTTVGSGGTSGSRRRRCSIWSFLFGY